MQSDARGFPHHVPLSTLQSRKELKCDMTGNKISEVLRSLRADKRFFKDLHGEPVQVAVSVPVSVLSHNLRALVSWLVANNSSAPAPNMASEGILLQL